MKCDERLSYLMLFCSFVVAAKRGEAIGHTAHRASLSGGALRLSDLLADCEGGQEPGSFALQDVAAGSAEEAPC